MKRRPTWRDDLHRLLWHLRLFYTQDPRRWRPRAVREAVRSGLAEYVILGGRLLLADRRRRCA